MRILAQRSFAAAVRSVHRQITPVRDVRARTKLRLVALDKDHCLLCEGEIDRFDHHTFAATLRCCACESALAES